MRSEHDFESEYSMRVAGEKISTVTSVNRMICFVRVMHKCREFMS